MNIEQLSVPTIDEIRAAFEAVDLCCSKPDSYVTLQMTINRTGQSDTFTAAFRFYASEDAISWTEDRKTLNESIATVAEKAKGQIAYILEAKRKELVRLEALADKLGLTPPEIQVPKVNGNGVKRSVGPFDEAGGAN